MGICCGYHQGIFRSASGRGWRRMGEWERGARLCGLFFPGFFFSAALRGA
jgi:hypothetical protein